MTFAKVAQFHFQNWTLSSVILYLCDFKDFRVGIFGLGFWVVFVCLFVFFPKILMALNTWKIHNKFNLGG